MYNPQLETLKKPTALFLSAVLLLRLAACGTSRKPTAATGGELFEIVPVEAYTDDDLNWRQDGSRVNREHDAKSLRDVALTTTEVPDWESYDTVFIGYPIWWGIAAWPVNNFVKDNDSTGKTVIEKAEALHGASAFCIFFPSCGKTNRGREALRCIICVSRTGLTSGGSATRTFPRSLRVRAT